MTIMKEIEKILKEDSNVERAVEIVKDLQYAYNNDGKELVPDETYDELYDFVRRNGVEIVGSVNTGNRPLYQHSYPTLRGTLDKIHTITIQEKKAKNDKRRSYEDFILGVERKIGRELTSNDKLYAFLKYDGISVVEEVVDGINEIALKRGDTMKNEAEDVPWLRGVKNAFADVGAYAVKNEIIMMADRFEDFCEEYGNFKTPLTAVSSILSSDSVDKQMDYITKVPLQVLKDGDDHVRYITEDDLNYDTRIGKYEIISPKDYKDIARLINEFHTYAKDMRIPCDGVVFAFMDKDIQDKMGRENNISKWEIAYKFPSEIYISKVIDIEYSAGKMGGYTPVVRFKSLRIDNKNVKQASLGSLAIAREMQLAPGDEIAIRYNIIPTVEGVYSRSGEDPIQIVTHCYSCGEKIDIDKERCLNPNCELVQIGRLYNFVDKLGIKFFSFKVVETLYREGLLNNFIDVFKLPKQIPINLISKKVYAKIYKNIHNLPAIPLPRILGSLGIDEAGVRVFSNILSQVSSKKLDRIVVGRYYNELSDLKGIGDITSNKIIDGLNQNADQVEWLVNNLKVSNDEKIPSDAIHGAMTGFRDADLVEDLKKKNIYLSGKITSKTKFLIIPDNMEKKTGKVKEAEDKGLPIYPYSMIGEMVDHIGR